MKSAVLTTAATKKQSSHYSHEWWLKQATGVKGAVSITAGTKSSSCDSYEWWSKQARRVEDVFTTVGIKAALT